MGPSKSNESASGKSYHADCHFLASAIAATANYPLWKMSAMAQSGFNMEANPNRPKGNFFHSLPTAVQKYVVGMSPPYRGVGIVVFGMTWARAGIFYGSDYGKKILTSKGYNPVLATMIPPVLASIFVQTTNTPFIRISITMQNPDFYEKPHGKSAFLMAKYLVERRGILSLWHGLSAGLLKTVPKYLTSVVVKDVMEDILPDAQTKFEFLIRATLKATVAGVCGAALTNPMDVLRNEMFKTDQNILEAWRSLQLHSLNKGRSRYNWMVRGMTANLVAVSIPVSLTIFLTDIFISMKTKDFHVEP